MKLWILEQIDERPDSVYKGGKHGEAYGFVVRAENEIEARLIASENAAEEGVERWINKSLSTCVELSSDGEAGVILSDVLEE